MRGTFPRMCPSSDEGGTTASTPRGETEVVDSFEAGVDAARGSDPSVSVVVATRDRAPFLPDLLAALAGQTMDPSRFEVVVVDDGSCDGTWPALEALAETSTLRLRGLRLDHSVGQGPARNVGVRGGAGRHRRLHRRRLHPGAVVAERPHRAARRRGERTPCRRAGQDGRLARGRPPRPLGADGLGAPSHVGSSRPATSPTVVATSSSPAGSRGGTRRRAVPTASWSVRTPSSAGASWSAGAQLRFEPGALVHHRHFPATYPEWLRRPARARRVPGPGPSE